MTDYKKAFVDTAPFIYFIERDENFHTETNGIHLLICLIGLLKLLIWKLWK